MKLKLVVASMSVLGLISCPAFAATQAKHKHQKMMKQETATHDYKDMGALPPVVVCPKVDMYTIAMDEMSQNLGRAKPTVGCDNPISFAGGINFDGHWGNRSMGYMGENNQRFSLNDAYLNVFGIVNDWTTAFMSATYSTFNDSLVDAGTFAPMEGQRTLPGVYSSTYPNFNLDIEQAFITFKNFSEMPLFVQLGQQFEDFSRYMIHPVTRSMTQVLSESNQISANIGFVTQMGFTGSAYVFDNPMTESGQAHTPLNGGVSLGYMQPSDQLGWDLGIGYMYNMTGANDVAYAVGVNNGSSTTGTGTYTDRVGAVALYGDVNSGPFSVNARYTTAVQTFAAADMAENAVTGTDGAKPWAAGIQAGYGFNAMGKDQNVYLGYQASGEAVEMYLPQSRWQLGYGVSMWKNANIGFEFDHDEAYSSSKGGAGEDSNGLALRVGTMFG